MTKTQNHKEIRVFAPAKINLFLHVTGKRENGYHNLQSLACFADMGDEIIISPAQEFSLTFDSTSLNIPTVENNLIFFAAQLLAKNLNENLNCKIHLTKNIPIGAGLGGGSADAAATVRGLLKFWNKQIPDDALQELLLGLGADVPICYESKPAYFEGIGEIITPVKSFPALHAILIYPNAHSSTQEIFKNFDGKFSLPISLPENFKDTYDLIKFLKHQRNDLTTAAIKNASVIQQTLNSFSNLNDCLFFNMSGSGSTCFGLFDTAHQAEKATHDLHHHHPDWWIKSVVMG